MNGRNADQAHICGHVHGAVEGPDLVGWQEEIVEVLGPHESFELRVRWVLEKDVDLGLVGFVNRGGAVMHLKQDVRPSARYVQCLDIQRVKAPAPATEEVALCRKSTPKTHIPGRDLARQIGRGSGNVQAQNGMVSNVAVSRPHFKRTNRQVVVGVGGKDELDIGPSCPRRGRTLQA